MCRDKCNLMAGRNAKSELPRKHVRWSIHNSRLIIKVLPCNLVISELYVLTEFLVSDSFLKCSSIWCLGLILRLAMFGFLLLLDYFGHLRKYIFSHSWMWTDTSMSGLLVTHTMTYISRGCLRILKTRVSIFSGVILHCKFKRS